MHRCKVLGRQHASLIMRKIVEGLTASADASLVDRHLTTLGALALAVRRISWPWRREQTRLRVQLLPRPVDFPERFKTAAIDSSGI